MIKLILPIMLTLAFCTSALAGRKTFVHLGRKFVLYAPENKVKNPALVVLLHGCRQDPSIMLEGTNMEQLADQHKFMVLAPEQPKFANVEYCWNWFLNFQQSRQPAHEMGQVVSAIQFLTLKYSIDQNRIFVAGLSAGGAMAHNLTACYPDVFAGGAVHSGLNFKSAESLSEARTVLTQEQKSPAYLGRVMHACARGTSKAKLKKVMIIHGEGDDAVPAGLAVHISKSQAVWRDYVDDGRQNQSAQFTILNQTIPFPDGYEVHRTTTQYEDQFTEELLVVKGLRHAWGGGNPIQSFFDPKAPSSSHFILQFFGLIK